MKDKNKTTILCMACRDIIESSPLRWGNWELCESCHKKAVNKTHFRKSSEYLPLIDNMLRTMPKVEKK